VTSGSPPPSYVGKVTTVGLCEVLPWCVISVDLNLSVCGLLVTPLLVSSFFKRNLGSTALTKRYVTACCVCVCECECGPGICCRIIWESSYKDAFSSELGECRNACSFQSSYKNLCGWKFGFSSFPFMWRSEHIFVIKGKIVPMLFNWALHLEGVLGSGGIAPRILWPRHYMDVSGQIHAPAALPPGQGRLVPVG
jgi:hypothetical protein